MPRKLGWLAPCTMQRRVREKKVADFGICVLQVPGWQSHRRLKQANGCRSLALSGWDLLRIVDM